MPRAAKCAVIWSKERGAYALHEQGKAVQPLPAGDHPAWLAWLAEQTAFSFQGQSGRINLLKESRRGEGYWYAYRRQGKRIAKSYLGRSAGLTLAQLEKAAQTLAAAQTLPPQAQEARPEVDGVQATAELPPPLLEPKLLLPRLHHQLVDRMRLLTRLDAACNCRLTILSAPAGFGKTTLVRQWIADRAAKGNFPPVAWVSLDAGDNDACAPVATCASCMPRTCAFLLRRRPPFSSRSRVTRQAPSRRKRYMTCRSGLKAGLPDCVCWHCFCTDQRIRSGMLWQRWWAAIAPCWSTSAARCSMHSLSRFAASCCRRAACSSSAAPCVMR